MDINNSGYGDYTIFGVIFSAIGAVSVFIGNIFIIKERNSFPLNKRSFIFSQASFVICFLNPLVELVRNLYLLPCGIYWISLYIIPFQYCLLQVLNLSRIYYYRRFYQENQSGHQSDTNDEEDEEIAETTLNPEDKEKREKKIKKSTFKEKFFRNFGSPKFNFIVWIVHTIVYFIIVIPSTYKNTFNDQTNAYSCAGPELIYITGAEGIYFATYFISLRLLFWKTLEKDEDILKIKREITVLATLWCIVIILWVLTNFIPATETDIPIFIVTIAFPLCWFLVWGWLLITVWRYRAYKLQYDNQQENLLKTSDSQLGSSSDNSNFILKELLNDPKFKEEFEIFLRSEWSLENLKFIESVERFKSKWDKCSAAERYQKAQKIYKKYIQPSPFQVNIGYETLFGIETQMKQAEEDQNSISKDIFNAAEAEAYYILQSDSLMRFKKFKSTEKKA